MGECGEYAALMRGEGGEEEGDVAAVGGEKWERAGEGEREGWLFGGVVVSVAVSVYGRDGSFILVSSCCLEESALKL